MIDALEGPLPILAENSNATLGALAYGFQRLASSPDGIIPVAMHLNGSAMKNDKDKCEGQSGRLAKKTPGRGPWQDRLKRALRENLKRRKSQARERSDSTIAVLNDDEVLPYEEEVNKPGK